MTTHYVYWYRLTEHCNPHCQGYIGITKDIVRRSNEHSRNYKKAKPTHFYNAINKYGLDSIHKEVLHECTEQEALEYELYYRPDTNIGWNMAIGGEDTLSSVRSSEVTLYHKSDPDKLYKFCSYTEASKELGINNHRISAAVRRKSPNYGFDGWAILLDSTIDRSLTRTIQQVVSERIMGTRHSKPSHFKGVTNRWSEEDKKRIGNQHKGKTISNEQVETVRRKNRANHSSCKTVSLVHKDNPDVTHSYHSISEASRQLDIPLSRLKSKAQRTLGVYGKDGWMIVRLGTG
jgi:hypothetical protein